MDFRSMLRWFGSGALVSGIVAAIGCSPGAVTKPLVEAPKYEGGAKCAVKSSQSRPLIVEWPTADRAALERAIKRGVVPVRYDGCEMELLDACRAKPAYRYVAITPKHDQVVIRDADELYASLPLGAASLEAKLERSGQLNVSMMVVGAFEAEATSVTSDELDGDCKRATHAIVGLTVGAFDFYAGGKASVGASAGALGVKTGAASSSERERLLSDGSLDACARSSIKDSAPPDGCGALIRVEVLPLGEKRVVLEKPVIDLGDVALRARVERPASFVDISNLRLEPAVLLAELTGDARAAYKTVIDSETRTRAAMIERAKADQALDTCRREGQCDEKKLAKKLDELGKKSAKLVDERGKRADAALKKLLAIVAKENANAAGATLYALASLERMHALSLDAPEPGAFVAVAERFAEASKRAPVESRVGWFARYDAALTFIDANRHDRATPLLEDLVRGPERPGRADAAYRLGMVRDELLQPTAAVDAFRIAAEGSKSGPVLTVSLWSIAKAAFRAARWKDSLEAAIRLFESVDADSRDLRDDLLPIAVQDVLRLGGIEREQLRTARPDALTWVAMAYATAALARYDLLGAASAWELVAERAPNTLDAPLALTSLASVYETLGNTEKSAAARKKLSVYTMTGPWADGLAKTHGQDELRRALAAPAPPIPPIPKTDEERRKDVELRMHALVTGCLPSAARPSGSLSVSATIAEGKPVRLEAKVVEDGGELKLVATCVERDGPAYFSGAENSAKLRVRVIPSQD